ncbi:hypothetical protein CORAM0001_1643 [Corynebacterium amycolatum SK46]|nr:hypothetical protein CORAM0001_1643 [Corynebacterium amycolatum SK46]
MGLCCEVENVFGGVLVFEDWLKQISIHMRYILNINNNSDF